MNNKQYILVLGGSTFMGLQLLQQLCNQPDNNYEVYYINRGKRYWNNKVRGFKNAHHIFGNRKEKGEYKKLIEYESNKLGINGERKWTAVFDFCAYKYSEVKIVYEALKGKVDLYLFISSDSIYDVCDPEIRKGGLVKEEMACRPTTLEQIVSLKNDDSYAHNKLKCEEFLYNFVEKELFPFIILRLPDVIGPYDDTGRFWAYMKWIQEFPNQPIYMDEESRQQQISLVFSEDVVGLCVKLIGMEKEGILFKSYNLGFDERKPLIELLSKLASYMDVKKLNLKDIDSASKFYPSVDCGPIDTTRVKELLGWNPTPFDEALKKTITFFQEAHGKYTNEESYAEKKLQKKFKTD